MKFQVIILLCCCMSVQDVFCQQKDADEKNPVLFESLGHPANTNWFGSYYWHDAARGHPFSMKASGCEVMISQPAFVIEASSRQIPYLIYPGERIRVVDTGKYLNFYIEGNPIRSHELQFFRMLVKKTGNIYAAAFDPPPYYTRRVKNRDALKESERVISQIMQQRMHLLDSVRDHRYVSDSFARLAMIVIQSKAFLDTLDLFFANKSMLSASKDYQNLIDDKVRSFERIPFIPFQFYYRSCQKILMAAATGNPNHRIQDAANFEKVFEFANERFQGATRDFALFTCLNMATNIMLPVNNEYVRVFNKTCENETYKFWVNTALANQRNGKQAKSDDMLLPQQEGRNKKIQDLIAENGGKILVLDFWASWCGPCRTEMPYSRQLSSTYDTDVAFIYISIDESDSEWTRTSAALKLPGSRSFRFANGNSSFLKEFKIIGVPRYMIVNKEGKIINDEAPPPSNPKLKEMLDRLLKKRS